MSATQNDFASRDDWRADYRVVPEMPAPLAPSSRAKSRDPAEVSLKITQRDPSTSVRDDDYFKSLSARRVPPAWTNFPQLRLSRPGRCSRALRIAMSETASTTHSKFA